MRKTYYCFVAVITLLHATIIFSQNRIILYDSVHNKPVSLAHIYSANGDLATVSNESGAFDFFNLSESTSDKILISHVSYQRKILSAKLLPQLDTIFMNENSILLSEVVVYEEDIDLIVREIAEILKNESISYGKAFYRQVSFTDTIATEWIEAFYDTSHSENGPDQVHLNQARFAAKKSSDELIFISHTTFPYSH